MYTQLILFILPLIAESMEHSLPKRRGMAKFVKVLILMKKEELCSFATDILYIVFFLNWNKNSHRIAPKECHQGQLGSVWRNSVFKVKRS